MIHISLGSVDDEFAGARRVSPPGCTDRAVPPPRRCSCSKLVLKLCLLACSSLVMRLWFAVVVEVCVCAPCALRSCALRGALRSLAFQ